MRWYIFAIIFIAVGAICFFVGHNYGKKKALKGNTTENNTENPDKKEGE